MHAKQQYDGLAQGVIGRTAIAALAAAAIGGSGSAAWGQAGIEPPSSAEEETPVDPHMPEALRSSIKKVVVIGGQSPANQEVTGSYEKTTAGLIGGIDAGSRMGTISKEIGGVPVHIPIPGLAIPGAIFGGLSGATKREIQEFRDKLTEELVSAENPPLRSDGLALDVFWGIRKLPSLDSHLFSPTVEIPSDTDAVVYVSFDDLTIDVQGKDAIISTSAAATVHRLSDGKNVYETVVQYQDRDTLKNWTDNENALWRNYTNFARYYLGREIAADIFDRVELSHELLPKATDSAESARKDERKFVSRSLTPTLAWELRLQGGESHAVWADSIDESDIFYDIEIFDNRQLVYDERQVPDSKHTVAYELEACRTYRWSVRPAYHVDGEIKFGEWMRFETDAESDKKSSKKTKENATLKRGSETGAETEKGILGRQASAAPAYIQDFASLEIECERR